MKKDFILSAGIEQDVKDAVEEFGKMAFKRFTDDKKSLFDSNDELNCDVVELCNIKLKPLPDLFAHDVLMYGNNAYQMWERINSREWINLVDNKDSLFSTLKRKKSASLRFNLERAKAKDAIEILNEKMKWITCKYLYEYKDKRIVVMVGTLSEIVKKNDLRMKYPKKCNHE